MEFLRPMNFLETNKSFVNKINENIKKKVVAIIIYFFIAFGTVTQIDKFIVLSDYTHSVVFFFLKKFVSKQPSRVYLLSFEVTIFF